MKLKTPSELKLHKTTETIGSLGSTELVRRQDGYHELIGGTKAERAFARLWCACFAPEVIFVDSNQIPCLRSARR